MLQRLFLVLLGCFMVVGAIAADQAVQYVEGKDYAIIQPNNSVPLPSAATPGKTQIIEFFSYGCHWCNQFEPQLDKWLAQKHENIGFLKIPVAWNPEWALFAKAYYTAVALNVADKITPAMFKAIHQDQIALSTPEDIQKIFVATGVKAADFDSAFNFSPGIDAQMSRGNDFLQHYGVIAIPTLVIAGRYKTDSGMVNGDIAKMAGLLDFLVKKAQATENTAKTSLGAKPTEAKPTEAKTPEAQPTAQPGLKPLKKPLVNSAPAVKHD